MQGFLPSRALGRQGWGDGVLVASSSPATGRAGLPATADLGQLSHGPGAPGGVGVGGFSLVRTPRQHLLRPRGPPSRR